MVTNDMRKILLSFDVVSGYNAFFKRMRVLPIGPELVQDLLKTEPNVRPIPCEHGKWIVGKINRTKLLAMFSQETPKPFDIVFVDANSHLSLVVHDDDTGEKLYVNEMYQGGFAISKTKETKILSDVIRNLPEKSQADSFLLMGESQIIDGTVTFRIDIDDEFDVNKLAFLKLNANSHKGKSGVLNDMLSKDTCLMNVIMYNDVIYGANQEDINIIYVYRNSDTEYLDVVNSNLESLAPERDQESNK